MKPTTNKNNTLNNMENMKDFIEPLIKPFLGLVGIILTGYWQFVYRPNRKKEKEAKEIEEETIRAKISCPEPTLATHPVLVELHSLKRRIVYDFRLDPFIYDRPNIQNIENTFRDLMFNKVEIWERIIKK
jgi:hypothetical protein